MELAATTLALLVVIASVIVIKHLVKFRNFPPGPPILPLVGSLHFIRDRNSSAAAVCELAPRYEHHAIFGFAVGTIPVVVVQDYDLALDLFRRDQFCGRPQTHLNAKLGDGARARGVIFAEGRRWTRQRRFSVRSFRECGLGSERFGSVIAEEAALLVKRLWELAAAGGDVEIGTIFHIPVVNVLWRIVGNRRFDYDDPTVTRFMTRINEVFKTPAFFEDLLCTTSPWLKHLPGMSAMKYRYAVESEILRSFAPSIDAHMRDFDADHPGDLMDLFIGEMKRREAAGEEQLEFDLDQLNALCNDLFVAGSETTSTTLRWLILWMVVREDVQERCRKELLAGDDPSPNGHPYCRATILEVLRTASVVPISVMHRCVARAAVAGCEVPEDSVVFYNIQKMHRDPRYWDEPRKFRPERFLDSDGRLAAGNPAGFLPFGVGKRACLGKSLAMGNLFAFFAAILRSFRLGPPRNGRTPDPELVTKGLTSVPEVFSIRCEYIA